MLRVHIVITETTKNCPTAAMFSLDIPSIKTQKTFGLIQFVLHFQCIRAASIELFHRNIRNATQMEFVQACFCVFTRHWSSDNKTAVGQFFVVSVIAMSKRNTIQTNLTC